MEAEMKLINLRTYYPECYSHDKWIDVQDEVLEALTEFERKEAAYKRKMYRYKAQYSICRDDGVEEMAAMFNGDVSPENQLEKRFDYAQLAGAIKELPEKQAQRLCAHFFQELKITEIAAAEGVSKSRISESIKAGLKNISNYLQNFN